MTDKQHVYGPAVPGQGSSPVCIFCGCRQVVAPETCPGFTAETVAETEAVYNPFNEELGERGEE